MRIGELAERTGVPTRLLRYYEEQGLLSPSRTPNGYRTYDEGLAGRVTQIRGLLDAGVPTRIIREILPCLDDPCSIHVTDATPELVATSSGTATRWTRRSNAWPATETRSAPISTAVRKA